ncbi:MAG: hypothetical protein UU87_C0002G0005 [Parcubacteria group bacterium GW2011_GWA2_42_11]|nr:MAG: hypothetical protein UU87_C0002G0005 [Parcubacteria group bacterium GW2011_GWA2_42_11]
MKKRIWMLAVVLAVLVSFGSYNAYACVTPSGEGCRSNAEATGIGIGVGIANSNNYNYNNSYADSTAIGLGLGGGGGTGIGGAGGGGGSVGPITNNNTNNPQQTINIENPQIFPEFVPVPSTPIYTTFNGPYGNTDGISYWNTGTKAWTIKNEWSKEDLEDQGTKPKGEIEYLIFKRPSSKASSFSIVPTIATKEEIEKQYKILAKVSCYATDGNTSNDALFMKLAKFNFKEVGAPLVMEVSTGFIYSNKARSSGWGIGGGITAIPSPGSESYAVGATVGYSSTGLVTTPMRLPNAVFLLLSK